MRIFQQNQNHLAGNSVRRLAAYLTITIKGKWSDTVFDKQFLSHTHTGLEQIALFVQFWSYCRGYQKLQDQ